MKNIIILVLSLSLFLSIGYLYQTRIDRTPLPITTELKRLEIVTCIDDYNLQQYEIRMPEYSGFSAEDVKYLREAFIQGFCDTLPKQDL